LSRQYAFTALNAETYLAQCKEGAKTREGYKKLHDEHVAKSYLYNYLHGRTFLNSPKQLWSELQHRLANPPTPPSECFDKGWFTDCYLSYVRGEISALEETIAADEESS
jgi:hypothetical protein